MDIENKIEEYLLKDGVQLDEADIKSLLSTAAKKSFKGVAWLIENGFNLLARKVSDELEVSANDTVLNKIDKIKNHDKKLKLLEKKAEYHKENFVRIIFRIESELEIRNKEIEKEEEKLRRDKRRSRVHNYDDDE